jgi:hypothetical protein
VKIKLGIKAWSTLSAMVLSLVVISGCNDENTPSTPPSNPAPSTGKAPEGAKKPDTPATTPPAPSTDKAKEPGKM